MSKNAKNGANILDPFYPGALLGKTTQIEGQESHLE